MGVGYADVAHRSQGLVSLSDEIASDLGVGVESSENKLERVFSGGYWLDERGVLQKAESESDAREYANVAITRLRERGEMETEWYLQSLSDAVASGEVPGVNLLSEALKRKEEG